MSLSTGCLFEVEIDKIKSKITELIPSHMREKRQRCVASVTSESSNQDAVGYLHVN